MSKTDINGRAYAKLADVKAGDTLIADGGFTCIKDGAPCVVTADEDGDLAIPCASGLHLLDGQDDGDGYLVGLYPATSQ